MRHDDPRFSIASRIADGLDLVTESGAFDVIAQVARSFRGRQSSTPVAAGPGAFETTRERAPNFLWGPLEVHECVGVGHFGDVYRAIDPRLQREVALKLRKSDSDSSSSPREFLEEARQLARVRHENVLAIYGADVFSDRVGIWTEFVRGQTLEEELTAYPERRLGVDEICTIGAQLALALAAVHESGLIHGDVSARNVIREEGGRILLVDFGCAVDLQSEASAWIGTPHYAAPEFLRGERPVEGSDLYSLAVLLYRLANHSFPYEGRTIQELVAGATGREPAAWPEDRADAAWSQFREAVDTGLCADPARRWPSARAFAVILEETGRKAQKDRGIPAWRRHVSLAAPAPLPRPRDAFVGRNRLLGRLAERLALAGGLTTLVGPGGSGKTRLCVEAALAWSEQARSIWFLDLVPAKSDAEVVPRIRKGLGLTSEADEVGLLSEQTRNDRGLLVLDNAEHVLDGVRTWVPRILDQCPNLSVVATSRASLSVPHEVVIPVPPLDLPAPGADWESSIQSESVQLFLDRCRGAGFALEENGPVLERVTEVCRSVDGLPLGLEIAASQLAGLPPSRWTAELGTDPGSWEARGGGDEIRHRSLRRVVEWALPLLSPDAQEVFAGASVFLGGWDEAAAVEVLGSGLRREPDSIRSALRELWHKSLFRLDPDPKGDFRYSMLATVRAVASDALARSGNRQELDRRHFDYFHRLFLDASAEDGARPSRSEVWDREEGNLTTALDHALANPDRLAAGASLAAELTEVWASFTDLEVSDRYTKAFLDALDAGSPQLPILRIHRAGIHWKRGEPERAEELILAALAEARSLQDEDPVRLQGARIAEVRARNVAGLLYQSCFRLQEAAEILRPALVLAEEIGDEIGLARALYALAWTHINGDRLDDASEELLQSLAIGRRCGDLRQQARSLAGLGMVAWASKDATAAISYNSEAYDVLRSLPRLDRAGEANILLGLGSAHVLKEDFETALEIFSRARNAALESGLTPLHASATQSEADIHRRMGNFEEAARLFRIALERHLPSGATRLIARTRLGLATSLAMCRRSDEAEREMRASFEEWFDEDTPAETSITLHVLGLLDRERGELDDAVVWFSAADRIAGQADGSSEHLLSILRPQMDEATYERAAELGASLEFPDLRKRIQGRFASR